MKKEPPVVHCIFAQTDETLSKLLETAFRQYLAHILAARDESTGQSMQSSKTPLQGGGRLLWK